MRRGPGYLGRVTPSQRLVVVSNRLPFAFERQGGTLVPTRSPGGLVTAVDAVLGAHGGAWVGWPGVEQERGAPPPPMPAAPPGVAYQAVPLTAHEVSLYYADCANRGIWPLFHYFVARTRISAAAWRMYERINARFAAAADAAAADDTLVWVHDYQLMLVPALVRRRSPRRHLAFFLHIPFPAPDVLRIYPWSRALLRGVLGADLVGVHVPEYAEHLVTAARRLLGCETDRAAGTILYEGRTVSVQAHPLGVDVAQFETYARQAPRPAPDALRQVLGVDRLDYTKGILERLEAVEELLERYPAYRGRLVFTQLLVPSRERVEEYQAQKRAIDEAVGRINGRFSESGWAPVRYLVRSVDPPELAAMYRQADVALVTPLRDGMNLVAKEYVVAQLEDRGVLVLSETAGAAHELPEALIVNPYDISAVAATLHRALEMPEEERRARMSALRHRVGSNDVRVWLRRFLDAADAAAGGSAVPEPVVNGVQRQLLPFLRSRATTALFLDCDGTLVPIAPRPELVELAPETRRVLEQALRAPDLDTVIVSGRPLEDVRRLVGVDGLTYIGDHGFHIEGPGLAWSHPELRRFAKPLDRAATELEALAVPGAWVERKPATLAYHVRAVGDDRRETAVHAAERILRRGRLAVLRGQYGVEGLPPLAWDKGQALLFVLRSRFGAEWPARVAPVMMGDDQTDELAFRALRGIGRSVRVGEPESGATAADHVVQGPEDVVHLVRWIASGAARARQG